VHCCFAAARLDALDSVRLSLEERCAHGEAQAQVQPQRGGTAVRVRSPANHSRADPLAQRVPTAANARSQQRALTAVTHVTHVRWRLLLTKLRATRAIHALFATLIERRRATFMQLYMRAAEVRPLPAAATA
jgi:hypothetical protein